MGGVTVPHGGVVLEASGSHPLGWGSEGIKCGRTERQIPEISADKEMKDFAKKVIV